MEIKKINYIVATDSQIIYSLSTNDSAEHIYLANTDKLDKLSSTQTLDGSMCFSNDGQMYHNLYDSDDVFYKSAIYKTSKTVRTGTTSDFQDVTKIPTTPLICGTQLDNTLYMLQSPSTCGRVNYDVYQTILSTRMTNEQLNDTLSNSTDISTIIYNRTQIQHGLSTSINPVSVILSTMTNIKYNMIYEMPGSVKNDYQSSNIAANTFKAKNQYNQKYDMAHDETYKLANCRDYIAIDKCNNQLYLKYYDNQQYYVNPNSSTAPVTGDQTSRFKHQNIEVISNVNRYANLIGHKSNLYSIAIKTDMISKISGKAQENIINEIKNITRDIVEKIAPVNTQLFDIYVNGK